LERAARASRSKPLHRLRRSPSPFRGGISCETARRFENHPALDASIRLRLPYIEPLNLLQIELMKRHRAGEDDPRIAEGILLSINAIATALRNSG
jgi:phosphoenolpyruvate carboxylase